MNKFSKIGIIGGSGLQALENFNVEEELSGDSPWGRPSSPVYRGRLDNNEVFFLPRHGGDRAIPPHKINYRANIAVLDELDVDCVLAFNVVGGISSNYGSGVLGVPDQIIDYTWDREHTYWSEQGADVLHADFSAPYDEQLRQSLRAAAECAGLPVENDGVYGATQGPRLESAAEIIRMEQDGCNVVGMTGMPEAGLAREKGIPYACLVLVANPAAGKSTELITMEDILAVVAEGIPKVQTILAEAVAQLIGK